jgi:hypothetical protein
VPQVTCSDKSKISDDYILWQDKTKCQLMDREGKVIYNFPGNLIAFINDKKEIVAQVGGSLIVYNKDLDIIWKRQIYVDHDVMVTPDDKILAYSVEYDSIHKCNIRFDNIYCFDEQGKQLFKWSTREQSRNLLAYMMNRTNTVLYKNQKNVDPDTMLYSIAGTLSGISADAENRELFHMNAFQILPSNKSENIDSVFRRGNLLLSFCNYNDSLLSFIAIVNPANFRILWYYVPEKGNQIHTPTMLENGDILMYLNASCKNNIDSSSVIEINPLTKKVVWQYNEKFPNPQPRCSHGSCQRLANGNTLISNISGYIYEVTSDKKIVWQWYTSDTKHLYRAYIYTKEQLKWLLNEED